MNNPRNDRTPAREMLRLALETQSAGMLPGDGARLAASDVHPDENELALYLSRELPPQASDRIEAHLAGCGECTEVVVLAAASGRKATSGQPPRSVARPAHADGAASGIERRLSAVTSRTRSAGAGMEIPGPMTAAPARGASPAVNETQTGRVARPTARPARSGWHRFRAAASIALLLLAGGVATAGWFALRWAGPVVSEKSSRALERKVSSDGLSVAVSGGPGLHIDEPRIADDPRFSSGNFAEASQATLNVDPAELLRGHVRGAVSVSDLVLRLIRNQDGVWNVETLGGERLASGRPEGDSDGANSGANPSTAGGAIPARAGNGPLHLTSANIANGKLIIEDRGRGTELVVDRLEFAANSPDAAKSASIALTGSVGNRTGGAGRVSITGTAGPFLRGVPASYDLKSFDLDRIPVGAVPMFPAALRGDLSWHGKLTSAGKRARPILDNLAGRGDVLLSNGGVAGANLARLLVAGLDARLAAEGAIGSGQLNALLETAAAGVPGLREGLAATETPFGTVKGPVEIGQRTLGFKDIEIASTLLDAVATGTIGRDGEVRATGDALLAPDLTRILLAAVPAAASLGVHEGRLAVPFSLVGTWPDLRIAVPASGQPAR